MSNSYRFFDVTRLFLSALLVCLLGACGGGGGGGVGDNPIVLPSAERTLDGYVGTWTRCRANSATSSSRETLTLTKTSTTTLSFVDPVNNFLSNNTCAGLASNSQLVTGTFTLSGQKQVGVNTVDKMALTAFDPSPLGPVAAERKQILFLDSTGLRDGNLSLQLDADGYPTALNGDIFSKQ